MIEHQSDPSTACFTRVAPQRDYRRAQRMDTLGILADGIAGEVSDLCHAVKASLRLSRADLPDDHVVQDYLDQAFDRLGAAEDVVGQLLALSRTDGEAAPERIDLGPLVENMLSLTTAAFPRALTVRSRIDDACTVKGRRPQLQQLVAELITTAGQSMEEQWHERPTVLDVSMRRLTADAPLTEQYVPLETGKYVHLAVSATGEGGATERPGPVGRGDDAAPDLAVARNLVEAHDGTLTVRREQGEGLAFNAFLPIAMADDLPDPDLPDLPASDRGGHVLVVDDDESVRTLEGTRLPHLGYEVTQKADPHRALTAVEHAPGAFDVALVDHHLPDMNGLELAHAFREHGCEASVVLMTGLSARTSAAKARVVGIDHHLQKPVARRELSEVLAQLG